MPDFSGALRHHQRVVILVSRYHERVTTRLLDGARQCCREAGIPDDQVDVVWVPGAWELGTMAALMAGDGVSCIIALGAVIRGETPHFDFVAGETSRVLADVAARQMVPVGFGLLTTETLEQALARAGGAAGNKGYEA
ncbi:MAG: 6,7-dimethyl-8-ribityllumazine synthase, partial [Gemmatimonadales bacterium]